MWHFKYPLAGGETYEYVEKDEDGNVTLRETRDYISIATTRPETMLGDGAVAVHPSDNRYAPIVGKLCEIPVGPKEHRRLIPIITDEYPDPDFGSGAVKITGAHDFNDYEVAKRGAIPMYRLMDTKGHMRDDGAPYAEAAARRPFRSPKGSGASPRPRPTPLNLVPDDLRGLDRFEARKRVIDQITERRAGGHDHLGRPRLGGKPKKHAAPAPEPGPPEERSRVTRDGEAVPLVEAKPIMAALWRPLESRHRAHADRSVVRRCRKDRRPGAWRRWKTARPRILPERDKKVYFHWLRRISSPGAFRASSGGGIRSRSGMVQR